MNCQDFQLDLGEYADRTLPASRTAAVEAHLADCASCRAFVADVQTLSSLATSLERRTPPPHVWTRIAATLQAETDPRPWWNPFVSPLGWRPLLASGVMVLLLSGATWLSWREATVQSERATATSVAAQQAARATDLQSAPLDATRAMASQISDLEGIVDAGAEMLPGETKAAYQVNDAVLEQAIGQSRAALESEPTDNFAQQSLFEALQSKLTLLKDMVALINEMRKGNQQEAARIVSGMEQ
jgi:anti-sigma factor RsiW